MAAGSSLDDQMNLELAQLYNKLPPIGALQNPQILSLFDTDEVTRKTAESIKQFREKYPLVELKLPWGSWLVREIGKIVPPFGFESAEHLANIITQMLLADEFEFSNPEILILQLAIKRSREEQCDHLVCLAMERIEITTETKRKRSSVSLEEEEQITAYEESFAWMLSDTETDGDVVIDTATDNAETDTLKDDMFRNQTVLKLARVKKKSGSDGHEPKRRRKDRSICGDHGIPLAYSNEMGTWFSVFVEEYEQENSVVMLPAERARLRGWMYKMAIRIGGDAELNNDNVFVSYVTQTKFMEEAARWRKEQPSTNLSREGLNVFRFRPLLLTFLASKCVEPDFKVVIARDVNAHNTPSLSR